MKNLYTSIFASHMRKHDFFVPFNDKHNAIAIPPNKCIVLCLRSSKKEVKIPDSLVIPVIIINWEIEKNTKKIKIKIDNEVEESFDSVESAVKYISSYCDLLINESNK